MTRIEIFFPNFIFGINNILQWQYLQMQNFHYSSISKRMHLARSTADSRHRTRKYSSYIAFGFWWNDSLRCQILNTKLFDILGKIYRLKRTNLPVGPFLINRLVTNLPVGPFLIYRLRWGLQPVWGRFATGCDWSVQCKMWPVGGSVTRFVTNQLIRKGPTGRFVLLMR